MKPVVLVLLVFLCGGAYGQLLMGSEVVGRGYDSQDQRTKLLPVFDAKWSGSSFNASECSPYISQHGGDHCFLIKQTGKAYGLPWFVTADNYGPEAFTDAEVTLITEMADVSEIFTVVTSDSSGGLLKSSTTTTTSRSCYQVMAMDSKQLSYVKSYTKYYQVSLDRGILELIFLETGRELLDDAFLIMLDALGQTFDSNDPKSALPFVQFLRAYGDYVVLDVDMGGTMHQMQSITQCTLEKANLNTTMTESFSRNLFQATFDVDLDGDFELNLCVFSQTTIASFFRGGDAFGIAAGDSAQWANTTWQAPAVVRQTVLPYTDIIHAIRGRKVAAAWDDFTDWYHTMGAALGESMQAEFQEMRQEKTASCCHSSPNTTSHHQTISSVQGSDDDESDSPLPPCGTSVSINYHCGALQSLYDIVKRLWDALFIVVPEFIEEGSKNRPPVSRREETTVSRQGGSRQHPPLLNGYGFHPLTGECTQPVVQLTYDQGRMMYSPLQDVSYAIPDQLEATDQVYVANFMSPLTLVVDLDAWLHISASLEIVTSTIFDFVLSWVLDIFTKYVKLPALNANADFTLAIEAGFEGGERLLSFSTTSYHVLETADYPFETISSTQTDAPFQRDVAQLSDSLDEGYVELVCDYGEQVIVNAQYGGQFVYSFFIEAEQYYQMETFYDLQISITLGILQCFFGQINTITMSMVVDCVHPQVQAEFFEAVNFSVTIIGGSVPELLSSFDYQEWVQSVQESPALLQMQLSPLPGYVEDLNKRKLVEETIVGLLAGNVTCPTDAERVVPSSTCYRATELLPTAIFSCSTTNIQDCLSDIDSCCSLQIGNNDSD